MDFRLTKEEALFQKMCREFALNEVEPLAAEIDEQERYPEETVQKLMKYGLMGIQFPKEVGGSGGNYYPDQGLTRAQFCKLAVLAEGHGD